LPNCRFHADLRCAGFDQLPPVGQGRLVIRPVVDGVDERLESDDTRIEIHHDSIGSLSFHEPLDATHRRAHAQYARYHDALLDYSDTLESFTGDSHDPVLYSGRPDIIIEIYDTSSDERLDAVVLGEIKYSDATQTFKQGLEELLTYRRFANKNGFLIDNPDVSLTSLLITNGVTTPGTSDEVTHLNGTDLLDTRIQQHLDWIPYSLRRPIVPT